MLVSTTTQTDFGTIEIIADEHGLREIILPGSRRKKDFPVSAGDEPNRILIEAAQQTREFLAGQRQVFALPVSIVGTPFQKQVWKIIYAIPYGQTLSYAEIGERLGSRNKARAVGGAAHVNPLPLVIPCHRVIGTTGGLTGFAGGLPLKKRLLMLEGFRPVP